MRTVVVGLAVACGAFLGLAQGTLDIGVLGTIDTLNPFLATTGAERTAVGWLYESLAVYREGTQQPWLAESWEVDPRGARVIFHIREGIKWHDGAPLTAEDVAFTFNYVREKRLPMWVVMAFVRDAVATGSQVIVNLTRYSPMVVAMMAPAIPIIPKHVWSQIENPMAYPNTEAAIGTGPFKLVEFAPGRYLRLENTGFYWRGVPKLSQLVLHMVASDTVGVMGFLRGDFDFLNWSISPLLADQITLAPHRYPNVHLYRSPGETVTTLLLNVRQAPLDQLEFRQALLYAIDREDMLTRLLRGFGIVAPLGLMTPRMGEWFNPQPGYPEYDPARAQALLDELGYLDSDGDGIRELPDGTPLQFNLICDVTKTAVEAAGLVAYYLREVGIKITVEPLSPDAFDVTLKKAEFTIALHSIAAFMVVDMFYYYFHSSRGVIEEGEVVGFNRGGFSDPELDEVLAGLLMAQGEAKRALAHRVQALIAQKLPRIPLYIADVLEVYRDDELVGWAPTPEEGVLSDETLFNLVARGGAG